VARIEVKRIHASAIVLSGNGGQALAFGPGHVELTPDAGERASRSIPRTAIRISLS
jgi:sortase A